MEKRYVPVVVRIDENGKKDPQIIEFDDKKIAMDAKAVEVEEYFNSIMAQSE